MRTIPDVLAARLGATTTLCRCWRLTRRDGTCLGFTEHDADLVFDGITHAAASGLDPAAVESSLGFAVGGTELGGALCADCITEADIVAGLYDGASVETFLVDWSAIDARLLMDKGQIGELRRTNHGFVAEVRSCAHVFDQPAGRLYQAGCDAEFGDARCGIDATAATFTHACQVLSFDARLTLGIASSGQASGTFANGVLQVTSGSASGARARIREHEAGATRDSLGLWTALPQLPATGDHLLLTAGCDKSFATCRDRFANVVNFRGFPHMPGDDIVFFYANAGAVVMDGGSLFK